MSAVWVCSLGCVFVAFVASSRAELDPIRPIERVLPPKGIVLPEVEHARLSQSVREMRLQIPSSEAERAAGHWADAEVFVKAVEFALENGEFYKAEDIRKADRLLAVAEDRIKALRDDRTPWRQQTGLVVRGFISKLDGSVQPYGVEVPESWAGWLSRSSGEHSCYLWLHGRGDTATDMHFIHERMTKHGQFPNADGIVVHAFGRHCLGYKSAGEIDVLEARAAAIEEYPIDQGKIALMGFSMGGAGAWHLGAHYPDRWAVVHAGAGFVDTRRYQNIDPATRPPWEVKLWGLYDVPAYRRNLLNVPLIVYSGELDKQKASADIMEEELRKEGLELRRVIGKGAGHKYTPEAINEIKAFVDAELGKSRDTPRIKIRWQTRTLRYPGMDPGSWDRWFGHGVSQSRRGIHYLEIFGLERHWDEARVDLEIADDHAKLATANVKALRFGRDGIPSRERPDEFQPGFKLIVDGQSLDLKSSASVVYVTKEPEWRLEEDKIGWPIEVPGSQLTKRPDLHGPIDDAFMSPFLVVTPSGTCRHPLVERWVRFELAHFEKRWREVFRGRLRMKRDVDVTPGEIERFNLILWGDASSNKLIAKFAAQLPIKLDDDVIRVGDRTFAADRHVASFTYPVHRSESEARKDDLTITVPAGPGYIVINSGPTFREAHDKTNSQQNPKLPDWAVIDLMQDPDAAAPGRVAAAGFFDEHWRLQGVE